MKWDSIEFLVIAALGLMSFVLIVSYHSVGYLSLLACIGFAMARTIDTLRGRLDK